MIGYVVAYMGTSSLPCPDCGEVLHLPHDYSLPGCQQPSAIRRLRRELIVEHALRMVILHPTLLPDLHMMRAAR